MKSVVLLSGGQDSTTCLAQACADFEGAVHAIAFDYGQRHRVELAQAEKISALAGVSFEVIELPFISELSENALTRPEMPIVHEDGQLPSTFVPGRNVFFLSVAAVRAKQLGVTVLYTGVCQTDFSGYPDCRDDFVRSLQQSLSLGMDEHFEIRTPLMFLTKAASVTLMERLGKMDWLAHSHTCYEGKRPACGVCPACVLRLKGFEQAGILDPLDYEKAVI